MNRSFGRPCALVGILVSVACASGPRVESGKSTPAAIRPDTLTAAIDTIPAPPGYTAADINFINRMIPHHAQALLMAGWAESHGASPAVRTLAGRIINAQRDEIASMQTWLRQRRLPVPEANPGGMTMKMGGAVHEMPIPGMLTEPQLKQLDAARGKEFDRLFLTFMIQHHQAAVTMVKDLFDTNGAAQDATVFKVASDISADQTAEIDRMQRMLAAMVFGAGAP